MAMTAVAASEAVTDEAREDIRTKVVPILGMPQGDAVIEKVAKKHGLPLERVIRIAKNMKRKAAE